MFGKGKVALSIALLLSSAFGAWACEKSALQAQADEVVPPRIDFSFADSSSVQQGNSFWVNVRGSGLKGLAALTMTLYYPTESFHANYYSTNVHPDDWGWTESVNIEAEGRVVYSVVAMGDHGIDTDEEIEFFSVPFYTRENAEIGACRFELNIGEAYDYNLDRMSIPSTHHFMKVEERQVAPSLQRMNLGGYVQGYDATSLYATVYGDWVSDLSAIRCSIVYDKSALSFQGLTLGWEMQNQGIYTVNSDTDGVILLSFASTGGVRFAIDQIHFTFKSAFDGTLRFHVNVEEAYDSNNRPVLCDPYAFETYIEPSGPSFSINKVFTSNPEFYADLRISENSHVAAADLGLQFDPTCLMVSGIESRTGTGEMISFDRRQEQQGYLPFSYINVNGLESEKMLARVYFRVLEPFSSVSTYIRTYVDHVVDASFHVLSLRTNFYDVRYDFRISSMSILSSWDGEIDLLSSPAFYALKGETFRLKVNDLLLVDADYGRIYAPAQLKDGLLTVTASGLFRVSMEGKIILRDNASYAEQIAAYATRSRGFVGRFSKAIGSLDVLQDAFTDVQKATLRAFLKEYSSYGAAIYPYLNPGICENGLTVEDNVRILRSRLNTAPKLVQKKLNFVVPMGGAYEAKIEATDDEDLLSFSIPMLPSIGTVGIDEEGTLKFKGHRGLYGSEEFKVVVSDGITNVILPVKVVVMDNEAPVTPLEKRIVVGEYSSYRGKIDAFDPEGDELHYSISLQPGHGELTLDLLTGVFLYRPEWGFFGFDSFAVDIDDGNHEITQHYYVNVTENKSPKGESLRFSVLKGEQYVGRFNATDAENELLSFSIFEYPSEGSLLIFDNGTFVYSSLAYSTREDYFSIKVSDGHTFCVLTAQISIIF